ncbi:hypothetical protein ACFFKU_14555 [Kineococcus gynurae]|uniref:O-antigen/teichoic acid export membrane protein n=1 Tax=Kineococcus gynurae TaxID=452979 RepID=A0ABV5LTS1_9ACTN
MTEGDRGPAWRRVLWNITDQGVSSLNNFLLQFMVAHAVAPDHFGAFAIAFAVYSVVVGLCRALATTPLAIRFADTTDEEFRVAARAGTGAAGALGLSVGVVLAGLGGAMYALADSRDSSLGLTGTGLLALAVVIPGLLLQDAWRQVLLARRRPAASAGVNVVWTAIQTAAVVVLLLQGADSAIPFILAWGGSAFLASLLGVKLLRGWPRLRSVPGWIREQWSLTRYLLPEFAVLQGGAQLSVFVVSLVTASTLAAGSLRGANLLMSPIMILSTSLLSFVVPELAKRRSHMGVKAWRRAAWLVSLAVSCTGTVWGVVFLLLPDSFGQALLNETWDGTRDVLLPIVVAQAGSAAAVGFASVLYAMDRAPVTLRIHIVYAILLVVLTTGGAFWDGAHGTAVGSAIAFWAVIPLWIVAVRRESTRVVANREREAAAATAAP